MDSLVKVVKFNGTGTNGELRFFITKKEFPHNRQGNDKANKLPDPVFLSIRLKMIKRPFQWYSKGKWIIEFFLKTNVNVDMD
jgi:hypothetical protein